MCTLRFEMIISYTKFMCIFLGFVLLLPFFFFTTIKTAGAIFCFRPGLRQPRILRSPACLWRARKKKKEKILISYVGEWTNQGSPSRRIWMLASSVYTTTQSRPSPAHRPSGNNAIPNSSRSEWSEKKDIANLFWTLTLTLTCKVSGSRLAGESYSFPI